MRLICLVLLFLVGCSPLSFKPINPDQTIYAKIRVHYQKDLKDKEETKKDFIKALELLKDELDISFQIVEESEFAFNDIQFLPGTPEFLVQELSIWTKGSACSEQHIPDGAATVCIFQNTITPTTELGTVLGAQSGPIVILSNLANPNLFINVVRHEFGHLLGAPHSKDLMAPSPSKEALEKQLPFPKQAVKAIRKNLGINQ